jgi:hypothetical protein
MLVVKTLFSGSKFVVFYMDLAAVCRTLPKAINSCCNPWIGHKQLLQGWNELFVIKAKFGNCPQWPTIRDLNLLQFPPLLVTIPTAGKLKP